jgi:RNA polymerase sigma-70 factor (ECF subfamily)
MIVGYSRREEKVAVLPPGSPLSFTTIFRQHVSAGALLPADDAALEAALARLDAEVRAQWPEVSVPREAFVVYLAERMPAGQDALATLADLQASDLFLACGCTRRDPPALAAFERHFMSRLNAYLQRAESLPSFTDEVKQAVRVRLLVSEGDLAPRIASYRGQGPLAVWLRLAAVRLAVNLRRIGWRELGGREVEPVEARAADPEMQFLFTHYRDELGRAMEGALQGLPIKDANLLRLNFFERLSAETIGAMHGVSARTVHRWIADIRERIIGETRRLLARRLPLTDSQFASVVGLVGTQLEVSVRRLLGAAASGADPGRRDP